MFYLQNMENNYCNYCNGIITVITVMELTCRLLGIQEENLFSKNLKVKLKKPWSILS